MDINEMLHVIKNGVELDIDAKGYLVVESDEGIWERTKFKLEQSPERVSVDAVVMHPVFEEEKEPPIGDYYFCKVWIGDDSEPEKRIIEWAEFKNVAGGTYMDWDIDTEEREYISKIEWLNEESQTPTNQ